MRFKQYVLEKEQFNLDKFKRNCSFYLDQMKGHHGYLFHGSKSMPTDYAMMAMKQRTAPRDSPSKLHNEVNQFFEMKFHYPFRNGLFASGKWSTAKTYGAVGVIFPIGEFEWLCNTERQFHDLTGHYERNVDLLRTNNPELEYDERSEQAADITLEKLKASKMWNFNINLPQCIANGNEIMLKCNSFYIFDYEGKTFQDVISPFTDNL